MQETTVHKNIKPNLTSTSTTFYFQFETPPKQNQLIFNSSTVIPETTSYSDGYTTEKFCFDSLVSLEEFISNSKFNPDTFFYIFSQLLNIITELFNFNIQLKLIIKEFIYIHPESKEIILINSTLLNEFCNDPHDIYFNKIAFKETIQFFTELVYKTICNKPLLSTLDFSHDETFNKKCLNFFKCNSTTKELIKFLFETNINSYTNGDLLLKNFNKIKESFTNTKNSTKKLYTFTTKPLNKKYIIEEISQSISLLKSTHKSMCYFLEGEVGTGKKYIQHYVTYNSSKEEPIFSLNLNFSETTQNDFTPFLNCFKWFIKQCIANSDIVFFNTHFFSTFSRNDQVLHVSLFPEIQYYLKDFPIPTIEEKNNTLSYNMNIVIENLPNLFILKSPLLINITHSNNITKQHFAILKNLISKINSTKVITITKNNEIENIQLIEFKDFLHAKFECKTLQVPLCNISDIELYIKHSYFFSFENKTEFINFLYNKTNGNILSLKHLLILIHAKNLISLKKNKLHFSIESINQIEKIPSINQQIQTNLTSLNENCKYILKTLACFDNLISISHLSLLNNSFNINKTISYLIDSQFLVYELETKSQSIKNRKLKFRNNFILEYALKLTSNKEKKETRFLLGKKLFEEYSTLNFENTMLMTFCISENFKEIHKNHNPRFIFNHALSLSKLLRNKGNYIQGNYLLTNFLKVITIDKKITTTKELKLIYIEKGYHLHFLKKYSHSHKYFLKATTLSNELSEKLKIGYKEVLLFNKKNDFIHGYKATQKYLKLANIYYPNNPLNKTTFLLIIFKNLFTSLLKTMYLIPFSKKDYPKEVQNVSKIVFSNLEMSIGSNNSLLLLSQILQVFNFNIGYKSTSFSYYSKCSFLLFFNYINIIYFPYKLVKNIKIPKFKISEEHFHKTNFLKNSFLLYPFANFSEIEQSFNKQIRFFMSEDNMFFTYASLFSKLFIQYLNGTPLNTIHETILSYYDWAKNYMQPLSLYENYLDFFTTLYKNKKGFNERINLNFNSNDTYFNASANLKLIMYNFYTNQFEKSLPLIPKINLNASTGPWFFAFKYYQSLTYGFLALKYSNKKYLTQFKRSSKIYFRLKKVKEFKLFNISNLLSLIECLNNNKLDKALVLYNKIDHDHINLVAVANEALGIYFKNKQIKIQSNMYYTKALNDYAKWGNNLKYNCLKTELKNTFKELNLDYFNTNLKVNNLLSSIKVAHTISSEKETNSIIKSLMLTIKDHINTCHISCILAEDNNLNLYSQLLNETYTNYNSSIRNHKNKLPVTLINYTFKTKEVVKLASLQSSISFYDNYINIGNLNSAICIPLINQNSIFGVLYIERNQHKPFNNDDSLFLNIICTHVANSLKNTILYEKNKALINNLEEKVKDQIDAIKLKEKEKEKSENIAKKAVEQAAYATLTRGIAHEIRNPMAIMLSGIELLQENINNKEKTIEYLEAVKQSILRLKNITTTMLRYGKSVADEKSLENINILIEDALIVSSAECKKRHIKVVKNLNILPETIIDPNSISQIFLNLILNSIEAINTHGTISIATNTIDYNKVPMIEIQITDTGIGISKNNITKIFNPFYTSKYKNTGLGLSIVLKIINEHQGKLDVDSELNKFTKFTILLPIKTN